MTDGKVRPRNHGGIFRIDVDPVTGALFILHGSTVSQWGPPPKLQCEHLLGKKSVWGDHGGGIGLMVVSAWKANKSDTST